MLMSEGDSYVLLPGFIDILSHALLETILETNCLKFDFRTNAKIGQNLFKRYVRQFIHQSKALPDC
jgi:hypothetical protein